MKRLFLNLSIGLFFVASVALAASWPEASLWNNANWPGIFYLLICLFFVLVATVFDRIAKQYSKILGKKCRFWAHTMLFIAGYGLGGFYPIISFMDKQDPGWIVMLNVATMFFFPGCLKKPGMVTTLNKTIFALS